MVKKRYKRIIMKNTVFDYAINEKNNDFYRDYTSYSFPELRNKLKEYPEWFMIYSVETDERPEVISYKLYEDEDYADVILLLNEMNYIWDTPYNSEVIYEQTKTYMEYIKHELGYDNVELPENLVDDMDKIENMVNVSINTTNDKRKNITVPKPDYLWKVLNVIDDYKKQYRIV
jgi:hypothetical protein